MPFYDIFKFWGKWGEVENDVNRGSHRASSEALIVAMGVLGGTGCGTDVPLGGGLRSLHCLRVPPHAVKCRPPAKKHVLSSFEGLFVSSPLRGLDSFALSKKASQPGGGSDTRFFIFLFLAIVVTSQGGVVSFISFKPLTRINALAHSC